MKAAALVGLALLSGAWAQTVTRPALGYAVDAQGGLRRIHGMPAAAHVGEPILSAAKAAMGPLALLEDGTALRDGVALPGRWAELQPGVFLDAAGRQVLVAVGEPRTIALPARGRTVRVSGNGRRVLALLEDGGLMAFGESGQSLFRVDAGAGWVFAFVPGTERAIAFDPASGVLASIGEDGVATALRTLDAAGGVTHLAVDASGAQAVLLSAGERRCWLAPLGAGEVSELAMPEGSEVLIPLQGGRVFQLGLRTSRPIWLLRPGAEERLLVIPMLVEAAVAQ